MICNPSTIASLASQLREPSSLPLLMWRIHTSSPLCPTMLFCFDYCLVLRKKREHLSSRLPAASPLPPTYSPVSSLLHSHVGRNICQEQSNDPFFKGGCCGQNASEITAMPLGASVALSTLEEASGQITGRGSVQLAQQNPWKPINRL